MKTIDADAIEISIKNASAFGFTIVNGTLYSISLKVKN